MNGKTMDERVTDLEKLAESLAPLPVRMEAVEGRLGARDARLGTVESQIVQLRTEMRVEFSAVRREMDGFRVLELRARHRRPWAWS